MSDDNRRVSVERRKLENEMFVFEGERKSYEHKKEDVLMEMARIRKDIAGLESTLEDLQLKKLNFEHRIFDAEEEMGRIKRKMNLL